MPTTVRIRANESGARSIVGHYLEEARRVHKSRTTNEPTPLGDQPRLMLEVEDRQDPEHLCSLIEPYLFYVVQVASEFNRRDVSFEDLLAEGNMGLVEAAHHYDAEHQVKFLTYATWWIRKRILEYLVFEGKDVRLTRYAREKRRELQAAQEKLKEEHGRDATVEELVAETGLERRTVVETMGAAPVTISIEKPVVQDVGITLKDCLPSRGRSPEQALEDKALAKIVVEEVANLSGREREIVENRFSLSGEAPQTFQEIGETMGFSRERARQIEQQALERLRRRIHRRISVLELPERPAGRIRRRAKRSV